MELECGDIWRIYLWIKYVPTHHQFLAAKIKSISLIGSIAFQQQFCQKLSNAHNNISTMPIRIEAGFVKEIIQKIGKWISIYKTKFRNIVWIGNLNNQQILVTNIYFQCCRNLVTHLYIIVYYVEYWRNTISHDWI